MSTDILRMIEDIRQQGRDEAYEEIAARLERGGIMDQNYAKVIREWAK